MSGYTTDEMMTVEAARRLDDGTVWYDLYAFSRPGHWLTRIGYPATRQLQWKFGRDSLNQYVSMTPILIAGLCYLIITVPLGILVRRLEAKQAAAR